MQFRQPIHVSQLEYELMSVKGVRAVNYITITQGVDYNSQDETPPLIFGDSKLYTTDFNTTREGGNGAFRDLADLILKAKNIKPTY